MKKHPSLCVTLSEARLRAKPNESPNQSMHLTVGDSSATRDAMLVLRSE